MNSKQHLRAIFYDAAEKEFLEMLRENDCRLKLETPCIDHDENAGSENGANFRTNLAPDSVARDAKVKDIFIPALTSAHVFQLSLVAEIKSF